MAAGEAGNGGRRARTVRLIETSSVRVFIALGRNWQMARHDDGGGGGVAAAFVCADGQWARTRHIRIYERRDARP